MFLRALTCFCFLISFIESRSIASQPVPWCQLDDKNVTLYQETNHNGGGENVARGHAEKEGLNRNVTLEWRSKKEADDAEMEEEVEGNVRPKLNAETKTGAQAKKQVEVPMKPKWQAYMRTEAAATKGEQFECVVKTKANTAEGSKPEVENEPKLKLEVKRKTKVELRKESKSESKTELEAKKILRLDLAPNVTAISQAKREAEVIQVLKTRAFPEVLKPYKCNTFGLTKLRGVVESATRTVKPFTEWLKTTCRHLPIDFYYLMSSIHRLIGGACDYRGDRWISGRTPRAKGSRIPAVDRGLKTLIDAQDQKVLSDRYEDGTKVPVDHKAVERLKISTKSLPIPSRETLPKTSPDPSSRSPRGSPPNEIQGGNGGGDIGGDLGGIASAENDITPSESTKISPKHSPQKSSQIAPPKPVKQSPSEKNMNGNGAKAKNGKSEGVAGSREDFSAPKTSPQSRQRSPQKSPLRSPEKSPARMGKESPPKEKREANGGGEKKSPPTAKNGANGRAEKKSPPNEKNEDNGSGEKESPSKEKNGANGRGEKESPPKEKKGDNGSGEKKSPPEEGNGAKSGKEEGNVPPSRYLPIDMQKILEYNRSISARRGGSAEDQETKKDGHPVSSSRLRRNAFSDSDAWKLVNSMYGQQQKE